MLTDLGGYLSKHFLLPGLHLGAAADTVESCIGIKLLRTRGRLLLLRWQRILCAIPIHNHRLAVTCAIGYRPHMHRVVSGF